MSNRKASDTAVAGAASADAESCIVNKRLRACERLPAHVLQRILKDVQVAAAAARGGSDAAIQPPEAMTLLDQTEWWMRHLMTICTESKVASEHRASWKVLGTLFEAIIEESEKNNQISVNHMVTSSAKQNENAAKTQLQQQQQQQQHHQNAQKNPSVPSLSTAVVGGKRAPLSQHSQPQKSSGSNHQNKRQKCAIQQDRSENGGGSDGICGDGKKRDPWTLNGFGEEVLVPDDPSDSKFVMEEDVKIRKAVLDYCTENSIVDVSKFCVERRTYGPGYKHAWTKIAQCLRRRSVKSVYDRAKILYKVPDPSKKTGKWSEEECVTLLDLVNWKGQHWNDHETILNRESQLIRSKFDGMKKTAKNAKPEFTSEEKERLEALIREHVKSVISAFSASKQATLDIVDVTALHAYIKSNEISIPWTQIAQHLHCRAVDCLSQWQKLGSSVESS